MTSGRRSTGAVATGAYATGLRPENDVAAGSDGASAAGISVPGPVADEPMLIPVVWKTLAEVREMDHEWTPKYLGATLRRFAPKERR